MKRKENNKDMVLEKNNTKWMVDKGNRGNFVIKEVKENNRHVRSSIQKRTNFKPVKPDTIRKTKKERDIIRSL